MQIIRAFYRVGFGAGVFGRALLMVSLCIFSSNAASPDEAFLDSPMASFDALEGREFSDLCHALKRPCGIEEASFGDVASKVKAPRARLQKITPRKILDRYIKRLPSYQWVYRNGVINVEPKKHDGEDVLSRKLGAVSISGITSFKAALDVFKQADIQVAYQPQGRVRLAIIDLTLKDVTVREALNAIVKADGEAIWFLTTGKTGRTFTMTSSKKTGASSINERRKESGSKPESK